MTGTSTTTSYFDGALPAGSSTWVNMEGLSADAQASATAAQASLLAAQAAAAQAQASATAAANLMAHPVFSGPLVQTRAPSLTAFATGTLLSADRNTITSVAANGYCILSGAVPIGASPRIANASGQSFPLYPAPGTRFLGSTNDQPITVNADDPGFEVERLDDLTWNIC